MNFLLLRPLFFSTLLLGSLQTILISTLLLSKRKKLNLGLFMLPTAFAAPLLLKLTGYYIIAEQIYLCGAICFWSLLKAFQIHRRRIYLSLRSFPWSLKFFGLNWLVLLPFSLYLASRPVYHSLPSTLGGLTLAGLSLIYEAARPSLTRNGNWKALNDVFHSGTIPFFWGLFLMISPQLMGTDWISISGPTLYTFLALRPWAALWSGDRLELKKINEIHSSEELDDHPRLTYPEYPAIENYLPYALPQEPEEANHTGIMPIANRHQSEKTEVSREYRY